MEGATLMQRLFKLLDWQAHGNARHLNMHREW
nr:hypothetical protein REQ54_04337 [Rhizobium sp. Q54]